MDGAERWPIAQRGGGRQKEPQRRAQQRDQPRQFQEIVSRNPEGRVGKLEVAINALGEDDPAVTGLKEALRQARLQPQVRPVEDRIKATKMFIERSRKRVDSVREEITKAQEAVLEGQAKLTKEEEALEDGLKRLNSLQQQAHGLSEQPPPPTAPADFARELAELRACVQALQVERDDLRAEVARQNVEGRQRNARSLAVPSPDLVMGDNSMQSLSVLAIRLHLHRTAPSPGPSLPRTTPPLDRPKFRSFFSRLPPEISWAPHFGPHGRDRHPHQEHLPPPRAHHTAHPNTGRPHPAPLNTREQSGFG